MSLQEILSKLKNRDKEELSLVAKAYEFAEMAHDGQFRLSGEPYFVHPFNVGKALAEMGLDSHTIAAGLLHDVCEDGAATEEDIKKEFGEDIAFLVEGVTKLGTLRYQGEERYAENLRKMFLAMAEDIRVVLIKLADRLHNMQTLEYIPERKHKRIADETLKIYAPLSDRMGMWRLKGMLEDLVFPYSFSKEYKELIPKVQSRLAMKETYLAKVKYALMKELKAEKIKVLKMDTRVKHLFSLHKKLQRDNKQLEDVHDLVAARVIVGSVEECYAVLGVIHKLWKPLPGHIKDYIALPKPNGYQSLHTTVFCIDGEITEFQIRTEKMDYEAKHGIAAHWAYSEAGKPKKGAKVKKKFEWIRQLREWQEEASGTKEFIESLQIDLFKDRIFAFTPKGDVIDLPEGATPVDFAYNVHSEIGHHCDGAKVNGKMASLDYQLKNGDVCEILTKKNKKPSQSWLEFVKTNYAKSKIRAFFREK